jgi:hypothetical protein
MLLLLGMHGLICSNFRMFIRREEVLKFILCAVQKNLQDSLINKGTYRVETITFVKPMQATAKSRINSPKNHTCRWYDDTQPCKIFYPNSTAFVRYKNNWFQSRKLSGADHFRIYLPLGRCAAGREGWWTVHWAGSGGSSLNCHHISSVA